MKSKYFSLVIKYYYTVVIFRLLKSQTLLFFTEQF